MKSNLLAFICFIFLLLAIYTGCSGNAGSSAVTAASGGSGDTAAPVIGNPVIRLTDRSDTSVTLEWDAAVDAVWSRFDIEYMVVYSTSDNIGTLNDAIANGTAGSSWSSMTSAYATGLDRNQVYYFNVLVRDSNGNKNIYAARGPDMGLWASSVTAGSDKSAFISIFSDSDGNTCAAGSINGTGTYNFGNSISAAGIFSTFNAVIVKYNVLGQAQWANSVSGGLSHSEYKAVTADSSGNYYAAGYINGTSTFSFGGGITAAGSSSTMKNAVLVKYNAAGQTQWARSIISGRQDSIFYAVTTDAEDNVYVAGLIRGAGINGDIYTFGPGVTAGGTNVDTSVVIVKYDKNGTALWARTNSTGVGGSIYYSLAVSPDGSIIAAGYITGTVTYTYGTGITARGSNGSYNPIIVKYDSSGNALWARSLNGGSYDSFFNAVTIDPAGNIYAAGFIDGNGVYYFADTGTYTPSTGVRVTGNYTVRNSVLVKYRSDGTALWARSTVTASGDTYFNSVKADARGNIYAGGSITTSGITYFSPSASVLTNNTYANNLLVRYDENGTANMAKSLISGPNTSLHNSLAIDSEGYVYAAGTIWGQSQFFFDNGAKVSAVGSTTASNAVILKY